MSKPQLVYKPSHCRHCNKPIQQNQCGRVRIYCSVRCLHRERRGCPRPDDLPREPKNALEALTDLAALSLRVAEELLEFMKVTDVDPDVIEEAALMIEDVKERAERYLPTSVKGKVV